MVSPLFHNDPVRRVLELCIADRDYTGPRRLATEIATATLRRNDVAVADTLRRAWRSGAPDDLLETTLSTYASAHDLDCQEAQAIAAMSQLVALAGAGEAPRNPHRYGELAVRVSTSISDALASAQREDSCCCPACIAEASALN